MQHQYIDALYCICSSEPISVIDGVIQPWNEKLQEKGKEILSIGDNLLLTCTERSITDPVIEILSYTAKHMEKIELAKSYAERLASLYCTRESISERVLEGSDGIEMAQNNILSYLDMLTMSIEAVRCEMSPAPTEQANFEQLCIDLWERVLGDKDLGFYHCRVAHEYSQLALDLAVQKRKANVFVLWKKWHTFYHI